MGGLQRPAPRRGDTRHPVLPGSQPLRWAWGSRRGHGGLPNVVGRVVTPKSTFTPPKERLNPKERLC